MRIVHFEIPEQGRRIGVINGDAVSDITAARPKLKRVYDAFLAACQAEESLAAFLSRLQATSDLPSFSYDELLGAKPGRGLPFLRPPVDH